MADKKKTLEVLETIRLGRRPIPTRVIKLKPGEWRAVHRGVRVASLPGQKEVRITSVGPISDKELGALMAEGRHFDMATTYTTCDDCGKRVDGEIRFGKMNVEDDTKPFIAQWCDACAKKHPGEVDA